MRHVTYAMGMSLDGYIVGPDGRFDWTPLEPDIFAFATDEVRALGAHLLGRRLYEAMTYWETADQDPSLSDAMRDFAGLWQRLPKVVFSRTLTTVVGNTRLAAGSLADEVARLRAEPGDGDIGIGGATLAAAAAELGLIDEYRPRVHPVLVGAGTPFFPRSERRENLELVSTRPFDRGIVAFRYRVLRGS